MTKRPSRRWSFLVPLLLCAACDGTLVAGQATADDLGAATADVRALPDAAGLPSAEERPGAPTPPGDDAALEPPAPDTGAPPPPRDDAAAAPPPASDAPPPLDAAASLPDAAVSAPDAAPPPPPSPDAAPPPPSPDAAPPPPPPTGGSGIWTSAAELAAHPMSGTAWSNLKSTADGSLAAPELYNQDSKHPVQTMAVALAYARTGDASYRTKAAAAIMAIIVSGPVTSGAQDGRSLALGRNLAAYAIAADLIALSQLDPAKDATFRSFLTAVRFWKNTEGRSLVECHEVRPNNWGTMCGASRIAADLYLGDAADLAKAIAVLKGYLGDRAAYAGFAFQSDAFTWMCDPQQPRPLNPQGCSKDGHDLSGAPVDDVQRGGAYTWPPSPTSYAWGGFSAAVAQAEMLHRAGYDAYAWQDQAIRRGMTFLANAMPSSESSATEWMPWIVNHRYGTKVPASSPVGFGRLVSWTDYTHD